ncbi:MAG TPA: hypothetical protein VFG34_04140 [Sphingopyxis sp.]|nr:hypothetical protein [Sphingopyxis sp.]
MRIGRQDSLAALIFSGAAVAGYFLWRSEGARLWLSDVAIFCGF